MVLGAGEWEGGTQEEDDVLVRAMEQYEENLARSRTVIDITDCQHVFRHVSEWDPRTSMTADTLL